MTENRAAVLAAADALVAAFGNHDSTAYFDSFSPDATFVFYNLGRTLSNRSEYEAEWATWERRDGFRVTACRSTERNVQLFGDVAILTHKVETELLLCGEGLINQERETIVFARQANGRWLAVHEHLSAVSG